MKVIDQYILSSYLRKFFSFFLLIMFVFIFQTIWMFIDDLAGKEIDFEIIFKFLIFLFLTNSTVLSVEQLSEIIISKLSSV